MKLFIILLLVFAAYYTFNIGIHSTQSNSNHEQTMNNTVTVYGRSSCSITQQVMSYMHEKDIQFSYQNIDDQEVADQLHQAMQHQGLSTKRYNLPVVSFNGNLSIRPSKQKILDLTRKL